LASFVRPLPGWIAQDLTWLHPQVEWTVQPVDGAAAIVHTTGSGAHDTVIHPTLLEDPLWPGRVLRLVSLHMDSAASGWALDAGGSTVCTQDGARTWLPCQPAAGETTSATPDLPDLKGTFSLGEPLPQELVALFPEGVVPPRLQAAIDEGNRRFEEELEKAVIYYTDPERTRREIIEGYYGGGYECSTQRVDQAVAGLVGLARMCSIRYPGTWVHGGAGYMLRGGYFINYEWHYYYYVLIDDVGNHLWANVTAADFISRQVGWRQLDLGRQNEFYAVQQTLDGGATWQDVATVSWLAELDFASSEEGWAIAWEPRSQGGIPLPDIYRDTTLVHTTNGGRTWEIVQPVVGPSR
jgi:hypothetical protein